MPRAKRCTPVSSTPRLGSAATTLLWLFAVARIVVASAFLNALRLIAGSISTWRPARPPRRPAHRARARRISRPAKIRSNITSLSRSPGRLHGARRGCARAEPTVTRPGDWVTEALPLSNQDGNARKTAAMPHEPPALAESPQVQVITAYHAAHGSSPGFCGVAGSSPGLAMAKWKRRRPRTRPLPRALPMADGPSLHAPGAGAIRQIEVELLGGFPSVSLAHAPEVSLACVPESDRFQNASKGRRAQTRGKLRGPKNFADCGPFLRADARTRTGDPFITSEVLYQLSYVGKRPADPHSARGRRERHAGRRCGSMRGQV